MTLPLEQLQGSFVPLVTPFSDGEVDYRTYARLVQFQIEQGSHGVVITGTTGEPSTLTLDERAKLLKVAISEAAGSIPVMAATGSQSLTETVWLTEHAAKAGADALLVVTPYYVKPSQRGLIEYFAQVGRLSDLPLLIYHIPGRAAVSLSIETILEIRERTPSLVGMKHAADDLGLVSDCLRAIGPDFKVFVGLEELSLPMLAVGACGLVNAVANVVPRQIVDLYEAMAKGDLKRAQSLHITLLSLNRAVFWDSNPTPVKYLMRRAGLLEKNEHRLPMMPATHDLERRLDDIWEQVANFGA